MSGWATFWIVWLWGWGFMLALAAVQQQRVVNPRKGRVLTGWDWLVCACWPLASPWAVCSLIYDAARKHGHTQRDE